MNFDWLKRIVFSPLALVYGATVSIRQLGFRTGLLRSSRFDIPIISVGNLNIGGSGKSPHIEYLIQLLSSYIDVSVLSRGYRRKTEGFLIVEPDNSALEVGDEPLQFKRKYPEAVVAVGERRAYAIPQMLYRHNNIKVVLLDDAYQHLAVKPYLNLLLTDYELPFTRDYLLPAGFLREWRIGYRRADIIIVTKCPPYLSIAEKEHIKKEINPLPNQYIYFSYYEYGRPYHIFTPSVEMDLTADTDVLLITGIANTDYLVKKLSATCKSVTSLSFEDHRLFSNYDVAQMKLLYDNLTSRKKVILTTEKDATRLELHREFIYNNQMDIFALPIEVKFLFDEGLHFDNMIKNRLLNFKI
jgi:tetraacyldisaccharide 4'-kinase